MVVYICRFDLCLHEDYQWGMRCVDQGVGRDHCDHEVGVGGLHRPHQPATQSHAVCHSEQGADTCHIDHPHLLDME